MNAPPRRGQTDWGNCKVHQHLLSSSPPPGHALQVVTPDPFLLALEGKWLLMERSSSSPTTWSAPLELAAVGERARAI